MRGSEGTTAGWRERLSADEETILRAWDVIVAVAATVSALLIPVRLVFGHGVEWIATYDAWQATPLFTADLLVRIWLARRRSGSVADTWRTGSREGRWVLIAGVLGAVPFEAIFGHDALLLLRLCKLERVPRVVNKLRHHLLRYANIIRLVVFLYWLGIATHWLACGWLAMGGGNIRGEGVSRYIGGLYWAVTTLATVGYGDIAPQNDLQRLYAMGVMIFGVATFGYVIGNITRILANIDPAKARYQENMERIAAFMKYRELPIPLQRRIRDYYAHLWEKRLGYDEGSVLTTLPPSLHTDVAMFLIRDVLVKVPIFQGADESFLRDLARQLRPVVFTPGDYVFHQGDSGHEMYFISRGTLEVLSGDGAILYKTLTDGDFFGEIALLEGGARTATVKAVDYCDLYALDRDTFERIVLHHPEILTLIQEEAIRRQERNMLLHDS